MRGALICCWTQPGARSQQRLRGIGVAVVDSQGGFRAFLDVLGDMAPALDRMSESQRSQVEKDLRDGNRDLARKAQEMQDDFNARRNEEMTRLQRSLLEEVNAYGKAQGYDLVLAEGVIYATNSLDITPAILTALQSRKGGGAAKPAAK